MRPFRNTLVATAAILAGVVSGAHLLHASDAAPQRKPAEKPPADSASAHSAIAADGIRWSWSGVERVVALGDVHGDYDQFLAALRAGGLIDANGDWTGGRTHLVQMGDVVDRAPDSRRCLELLMKLERQAASAGGAVHSLLGNHELLVMAGDFRYADPGELAAFGGRQGYIDALGPDGTFGRWLRKHNMVIRINDVLFVHGGVNEAQATIPPGRMNADLRGALRARRATKPYDRPTWNRDWSAGNQTAAAARCDALFAKLGVRHAIVGHTPKPEITVRAGGRVICVDVGMSEGMRETKRKGPVQVLIIDQGRFFRAAPGEEPVGLKTDPY